MRAVVPPRGILVVGAGTGASPWVQWLSERSVGAVWLVEGDKSQYQHLQRNVLPERGWVVRRDVVADAVGPVTFYRASNPAESGLIAPERLRGLWPHLETADTDPEAAATTLDALWNEAQESINWLLLDCLPAGALLKGGTRMLERVDLAVLRIAANNHLDTGLAARHDEVDPLARAAGLKCVQLWPQRHPAVMHALYVRDPQVAQRRPSLMQADWEKEKAELVQASEKSARLASELQTKAKLQDQKLAQLQQRLDEADCLNTLLRDELDKAEAHVALIRKLLKIDDQA
jgi:hypothetical protein